MSVDQANEHHNVGRREQILAKSVFLLFLVEIIPRLLFSPAIPIYCIQNFALRYQNKDDELRKIALGLRLLPTLS